MQEIISYVNWKLSLRVPRHVNAPRLLWRIMENQTALAAFLVTLMISAVAGNFNSMEDRMDSQQDYAESLSDKTDNLEDRDDELAARDNELAAEANQMLGMVTMQGQSIQMLSEDVAMLIDGPQWIFESGDSSNTWTLSLNDSQWLEVKSAAYIWWDSDGVSASGMHSYLVILEDEGWAIRSPSFPGYESGFDYNVGMAPIFGGDWTICRSLGWSMPRDCDNGFIHEWSVIYRVHDV